MKYLIVFILINSNIVFSQAPPLIDQFQYGATLKAKFDFNFNSKNDSKIHFYLSSNIGVASKWLIDELYPSLNTEFHLYNGGLGSKSTKDERGSTFDAIIAFTMTAGKVHDSFYGNSLSLQRNVPLYYFADFANQSLQNPYNYSISLGTNIVLTTDVEKANQRLGFLNINHSKFQVSYYNDGTPFQHFLLGDGRDRYYTGGAVVSYNRGFDTIDNINSYSFQLSYHKFTGYNQNSFEIANIINASNVDYKDSNQIKYNKSLWRLNIQSSDLNNGYALALSNYNSVKLDAQHTIHWLIDNAFHIVPNNQYFSLEPASFVLSTNFKSQ